MKTATKKLLALLLALAMVVGILPALGLTGSTGTAQAAAVDARILHLDCGRKYFTVDWVKALIVEMKAAGYNQLQLAFGNDGLRFVLDDMSVTVGETTYASDDVKAGIINGNGDSSYWTESDMNAIISAARDAGIDIVPLLNNPGHMNAIISAMGALGISGAGYNGSASVDFNNTTAVAFTKALITKYIEYFSGKTGYFGLGADEYANDIYKSGGMGFEQLQKVGLYSNFVNYVNEMAAVVIANGMTPRVFNDGVYYNDDRTTAFNSNIQVYYWSSGWNGYNVASAASLANAGFSMINTNGDYYYVLGKDDRFDNGYDYATSFSNTAFMGSEISNPAGSMFCIWCDTPGAEPEEKIAEKVRMPLRAMAARMQDNSIDNISTDIVAGGFNADGTVATPAPTEVVEETQSAPAKSGTGEPEYAEGTVGQSTTEGSTTYVLDTDGVDADEKYLIVAGSNSYALRRSGTSIEKQPITIDGSNATITENVDDSLWVFSGSDSGTIKNGDYYLRNNSNNLRISSTSTNWTIDNRGNGNYRISSKSDSTTRYLVYSNNDWTLSRTGNVRLFKQVITSGITTYTVDIANLEAQLNHAKGLNAADYSNWETLDIAGLITAAQTALDNTQTSYTTQEAAQAQQTAVNTAAQALQEALAQLSTTPTYEVTVHYYAAGTTNALAPDKTIKLPAGEQTVTPVNVDHYTTPEAQTVTVLADGTTVVTFEYVAKATHTVTYQWTNAPAGVSLPNVGTAYEGEEFVVDAEYPANYTFTTVDGDKYSFSGWSQTGSISVTANTVINGNWVLLETNAYVADTLTLEYWITNGHARVENNNTSATSVVLNSTDARLASADGVAVTDIAPGNTYYNGRMLQYWRCRILNKELANNSANHTEEQVDGEAVGGDDETYGGVGFTRIRFYNGRWQVFVDGSTWQTVEVNTSGTIKNQLVAYYLEMLRIADELDVLAADWGTRGDGSSSWGYSPEYYKCSVSVQVVYLDGTTNPAGTSASDLRSKTIIYGYSGWNTRGIGTLYLQASEGYEVYWVTSETGALTSSNGSNNTVTINSFSWDGNAKTVWGSTEGQGSDTVTLTNSTRGPSNTDPLDNLMWDEGNESILIRIYIKAKATQDSLAVEYYDRASGLKFYDYNIAVSSGTLFSENITTGTNASNELVFTSGNTVVNALGVSQTVQSNLSTMPAVPAKYKSGAYTFYSFERSSDGKTLKLYYDCQNTYTFVYDYGIPMNVRASDLKLAFEHIDASTSINDTIVRDNSESTSAKAGSLTYIDGNAGAIGYLTYTPAVGASGTDVYSVTIPFEAYTDDNGNQIAASTLTLTVKFLPATTVYYEDSYVTTTGKWESVGATTEASQAADQVGKESNLYGYDPAYDACSTYSLGSAAKTTVSTATYANDGAWPTASFEFYGTGFDIISLTSNATGTIFVTVTDSTGTVVKNQIVNTYYGYAYDEVNGWTTTDSADPNALYQIPVIKVEGLTYGKYNVVIKAAYSEFFDSVAGSTDYDFYLDAIRVYDPAGPKLDETYKLDGEGWPKYMELRDKLISDGMLDPDGNNDGAVFIDGMGETDVIAAYTNYGPNNEVYLLPGQAIAFSFEADANIESVQIGLKNAAGTSSAVVLNSDSFNGTVDTTNAFVKGLATATDMYYDVTSYMLGTGFVVIANNGEAGSILSVTNIKVTYKTEPVVNQPVQLANISGETATYAVMMVRSMFAPEVPVYEPETFTVKLSATNIKVGKTLTVTVKTSGDAEYITVNGATVTRSKLDRRSGNKTWTYTVTPREAGELAIEVIAYNAEDIGCEPIEKTVNVTAAKTVSNWSKLLKSLFGWY